MTETACTYCGSDVETHQPVYVFERATGNDGNEDSAVRDRTPAGQFCNYACLSASIDEEELVYGDACSFDPSE